MKLSRIRAKAMAMGATWLLLSAVRAAWPEENVPAAPILPETFAGWTNTFRLANDRLKVVVVPATGRIAYLGLNGSGNLLRLDEQLKGHVAQVEAPDFWFNFGGDWLWPVAQARWPDFQDGDWPPSRLLDGRPWKGRAWKGTGGDQRCVLSQEYGAPLHLKITRSIRLPKNEARLEIHQRVERTDASPIPVTLWNLTQVANPDRVIIPTDPDSNFERGIKALKFGWPGDKLLTFCDAAVVYGLKGDAEHKLGSDSGRAWIAAQKGNVVIVEQAVPDETEGRYPDGGCRVQMYAHAGLGYAELETLSVENHLAPGESMSNTLHIRCFQLMHENGACELAEQVRTLLGERAAPEPPSPEP